jgi:hypothetical protein
MSATVGVSELVQCLIEHGIEFIRFEQTDTHGISRCKTVPVKHFEYLAKRGLNFLLGHLGFDAQGQVAGVGFPRGFARWNCATSPCRSSGARLAAER